MSLAVPSTSPSTSPSSSQLGIAIFPPIGVWCESLRGGLLLQWNISSPSLFLSTTRPTDRTRELRRIRDTRDSIAKGSSTGERVVNGLRQRLGPSIAYTRSGLGRTKRVVGPIVAIVQYSLFDITAIETTSPSQ